MHEKGIAASASAPVDGGFSVSGEQTKGFFFFSNSTNGALSFAPEALSGLLLRGRTKGIQMRQGPAVPLSAPVIRTLLHYRCADVRGKDRDLKLARTSKPCHVTPATGSSTADSIVHVDGHVTPLRGIPGLSDFPQVCVGCAGIRAAGSYLLAINTVKCDTKEEGTAWGSELRLPTRRQSMGGSCWEIKATSNMTRNPRVSHNRIPGSERQRWRRSIWSTRRVRYSWRHLARSVLPSCNQLSRVRWEHGSILFPV